MTVMVVSLGQGVSDGAVSGTGEMCEKWVSGALPGESCHSVMNASGPLMKAFNISSAPGTVNLLVGVWALLAAFPLPLLPLPFPFGFLAILMGSEVAVSGACRWVLTSGGDAEVTLMGLASVSSVLRHGGAKSPRLGHLRERA